MNRYLEVFWMVLTIVALCMALYLFYVQGYEKSKYWLMLPLLPAAMWIMRRSLRIRLDNNRKMEKKNKRDE